VLSGRLQQLREWLLGRTRATPASQAPLDQPVQFDEESLRDKLQAALIEQISRQLKLPAHDIDVAAEFSDFGYDSISLTQFANELNQLYQLQLSPTLFFEHPTLQALAQHLLKQHGAPLARYFNLTRVQAQLQMDALANSPMDSSYEAGTSRFLQGRARPVSLTPERDEGIAIVGMSGCFPQANTLEAFWENLKSGRDCIGEVPASRWDWRALYGDPQREENKTNIKWGGFIEGMESFDPLFFGISPREAELMDPAQRLLLLFAW
jgi:polyketide synthase PksN